MTVKERNAQLRKLVKKLKENGITYKVFWNVIGISSSNFYNWMSERTTLNTIQLNALETFIRNTFNVNQ